MRKVRAPEIWLSRMANDHPGWLREATAWHVSERDVPMREVLQIDRCDTGDVVWTPERGLDLPWRDGGVDVSAAVDLFAENTVPLLRANATAIADHRLEADPEGERASELYHLSLLQTHAIFVDSAACSQLKESFRRPLLFRGDEDLPEAALCWFQQPIEVPVGRVAGSSDLAGRPIQALSWLFNGTDVLLFVFKEDYRLPARYVGRNLLDLETAMWAAGSTEPIRTDEARAGQLLVALIWAMNQSEWFTLQPGSAGNIIHMSSTGVVQDRPSR
jgi:hypothetical protein